MPAAPGKFSIEIPTWRPALSWFDRVKNYFVGGSPELVNDNVVSEQSDRFRLETGACN